MSEGPQAFLLLILAFSLMAPGAALAQSAGDEQYSDPFAEEQQIEQEGQQQAAESGEVESSPTETSSGSDEPVAEAAQDDRAVLPVTGAPVAALAAVGAGLLAGGALLRRRT